LVPMKGTHGGASIAFGIAIAAPPNLVKGDLRGPSFVSRRESNLGVA